MKFNIQNAVVFLRSKFQALIKLNLKKKKNHKYGFSILLYCHKNNINLVSNFQVLLTSQKNFYLNNNKNIRKLTQTNSIMF